MRRDVVTTSSSSKNKAARRVPLVVAGLEQVGLLLVEVAEKEGPRRGEGGADTENPRTRLSTSVIKTNERSRKTRCIVEKEVIV